MWTWETKAGCAFIPESTVLHEKWLPPQRVNVGILPGDLLAESGVAPEATKAATASLKEAISRVLNIFFF